MRDGVRLYTLILAPRDTAIPMPVLLLRTPYNAKRTAGNLSANSLQAVLGTRYMGSDYIYVPGYPGPCQIGGRLFHVPGSARPVQPNGYR